MSAQSSAAPPVLGASADVHVTGRRIVATIVDGLVFGGLYALMAVLFGTYARVDAFGWDATMPALEVT